MSKTWLFRAIALKNICNPIFTSMFVERMVDYREKFEVELSTLPDSTYPETSRKLVFSLSCVGVSGSVCLFCAKKFVSGYLTNKLTDFDENFGVSCNWTQSLLADIIGPIFPNNLSRGVIFALLCTLVS